MEPRLCSSLVAGRARAQTARRSSSRRLAPPGILWGRDPRSAGSTAPLAIVAQGSDRKVQPPSFASGGPLLQLPVPSGRPIAPTVRKPTRIASLWRFSLAGFTFAGGIGLRYWRDEFHSWDGSAYHAVPGSEIRAQLTRWIADEFERLYRLALDGMVRSRRVPAASVGGRSDRRGAAASRGDDQDPCRGRFPSPAAW